MFIHVYLESQTLGYFITVAVIFVLILMRNSTDSFCRDLLNISRRIIAALVSAISWIKLEMEVLVGDSLFFGD